MFLRIGSGSVKHIRDNPILSFADHFEQEKTINLRFKDDLRA